MLRHAVALTLCAVLAPSASFAGPVEVVFGQSWDGPSAELQSVVDNAYGPGLINLHGHIQDERGGLPQPTAYQNKLWLASGITTVREVSSGSEAQELIPLREQSAGGTLEAPRFFICAGFTARPTPRTPEQARARVQELKRLGVDCIKIPGLDRDIMSAMLDEARKGKVPLRTFGELEAFFKAPTATPAEPPAAAEPPAESTPLPPGEPTPVQTAEMPQQPDQEPAAAESGQG